MTITLDDVVSEEFKELVRKELNAADEAARYLIENTIITKDTPVRRKKRVRKVTHTLGPYSKLEPKPVYFVGSPHKTYPGTKADIIVQTVKECMDLTLAYLELKDHPRFKRQERWEIRDYIKRISQKHGYIRT